MKKANTRNQHRFPLDANGTATAGHAVREHGDLSILKSVYFRATSFMPTVYFTVVAGTRGERPVKMPSDRCGHAWLARNFLRSPTKTVLLRKRASSKNILTQGRRENWF